MRAAGQSSSLQPAPTATPTLLPGPYTCKTGDDYTNFEPDSNLVTQVCPAHNENIGINGMLPPGPLYIVIHNTGNQSATAIQGNINWFQDDSKDASAQYIVGLDDQGKVQVIQMVREADWAWHAGNVTAIEGNLIQSNNSIGIEVVGIGTLDGWPADSIYTMVADLVKDIAQRHNIDLNRNLIVGHEEISTEGKKDPGPNWDWQRFIEIEVGGTYKPAAQLNVLRDVETNRITFNLTARHNFRTGFRVEASRDEAPFQQVTQIGVVANKPNYNLGNPRTFDLTSYVPEIVDRPVEICYRTITVQDSNQYINPSNVSCIIHGMTGETYEGVPRRDGELIAQNAYPIVKPNQEVTLSFTLLNAGILSWKPDGRYVLINAGGDSLNLPTAINVAHQTYTNEKVVFELKFPAPAQYGAYTTLWQLAYIDPETHKIELFGDEMGAVVTVLPENASDDLMQIVRAIIDNAVQSAEQSLDEFLDNLKLSIQEKIEEEVCRTAQKIPCLAPLFCMAGLMGVSVDWLRKRAKYDHQR